MKAILAISLCLFAVWTTAWNPHASSADRTVPATVETALGDDASIGAAGAVFATELAEAEGGWWNWIRKILRAILDLIPGGEDDCECEPQT